MAEVEVKKIKGFEDYSVDSLGNIYGKFGKVMKLQPRKGYSVISLRKDGKYKNLKVHRVVWIAFKGRIRGVINHKDGIRSNNDLKNLEDISPRENNLHWMKAKSEGYKSPLTGIRLRSNGRFRARIMFKGKIYETDRNTESKAVEWYDAKCRELGIASKYIRR